MSSIYSETEGLRSYLSARYSYREVENICDDFANAINSAVLEISSSGIRSAIDAALDMGADEFIEDMTIMQDGSGFGLISSHSGNLDYTRPEKRMLPNLLQNAKTSQDGHRYKVIPMHEKSKKVVHSMFEQMREQQSSNDLARSALRARGQQRRNEIAGALQESMSLQRHAAGAVSVTESSGGDMGPKSFRTASDKQDPATAWVIPEKNMDLTDTIREINTSIAAQCEQAIAEIAKSYYAAY